MQHHVQTLDTATRLHVYLILMLISNEYLGLISNQSIPDDCLQLAEETYLNLV